MKIRIVKPVGDRLIPYPKPPYAPISPNGQRVEFPGPDGYWARLEREGVITAEVDVAIPVEVPATTTKKGKMEG